MKQLELSNGKIIELSWSYYQNGYNKLLFLAIPSEDIHRFAEFAKDFEETEKVTILKKEDDKYKEIYAVSSVSSISYTPISYDYNITLVVG